MKKIKIMALLSAIITALLLFLFLNSLQKPQTIVKSEVLVATVNIPLNTQVTKDMIVLKQLPREAVNATALSDSKLVIGKVAKSDIAAGEQLLTSKFFDAGKSGSTTLAYSIEPGMRAITIAVDDVSGLSGMLKPGNSVDVIAKFDPASAGGTANSNTTKYTKMLLQDVPVLAVDSVLSESGKAKNKDGTTASYTSVTLEVTPAKAMEISMSEYVGKLKVILRSPLDQGLTSFPNMTLNDVLK